MPRFVLLYHECPPSFRHPSHWDLMLERDGALMTWRLDELPASWRQPPTEGEPALLEITATRLPDHRLAYLDYEGPLSGERGDVIRVDRGDYTVVNEAPHSMEVHLTGANAIGDVRLRSK